MAIKWLDYFFKQEGKMPEQDQIICEGLTWTWNEESETWFYGDQKKGMGIYQDDNGFFYANVAHPNIYLVIGLGTYPTLEFAMKEMAREFQHCEECERTGNC